MEHTDIKMNLAGMDKSALLQFANMVRDELVAALARERETLESISSNTDLNTIIKERDEFKHLYLAEVKKVNQSRRIISGKSETCA